MGLKLKLAGLLILFMAFSIYQITNKGARLSFHCSVFNISCPKLSDIKLSPLSTYDKEYEKVVEDFRQLFVDGTDIGAQLSIYYKNKNVINISAGKRNIEKDLPYEIDTLQHVYSSGKALCSLVVSMLVDRGLLKYEEKIGHYWPEFAVNGKEDVTIADLLQHKSGTILLDKKLSMVELRNMDKLSIILAAQPHHFDGKPVTAYSSVLIGNYINEIVRRVDPKKRNIDEFVNEEINKPLGTELYFTITKEMFDKRFGYMYFYPLFKFITLIVENWIIEPLRVKLGYEPDVDVDNVRNLFDENRLLNKSFKVFEKDIIIEHSNEYETATLLFPGACLKSNAHSIAKVSALIANGGELDGIRLLSKESLDKALELQEAVYDINLRIKFVRSQNGWATIDNSSSNTLRGNNRLFGWTGFGGSSFIFNIDKNFSVSYVMNGMGNPKFTLDPRAFHLAQRFYDLIENDK